MTITIPLWIIYALGVLVGVMILILSLLGVYFIWFMSNLNVWPK